MCTGHLLLASLTRPMALIAPEAWSQDTRRPGRVLAGAGVPSQKNHLVPAKPRVPVPLWVRCKCGVAVAIWGWASPSLETA